MRSGTQGRLLFFLANILTICIIHQSIWSRPTQFCKCVPHSCPPPSTHSHPSWACIFSLRSYCQIHLAWYPTPAFIFFLLISKPSALSTQAYDPDHLSFVNVFPILAPPSTHSRPSWACILSLRSYGQIHLASNQL